MKKIAIFAAVGCIVVGLDYGTYLLLLRYCSFPIEFAKAIGFVFGTVLSYVLNRFWTFRSLPSGPGSWWRFAALYLLTMLVNIGVNSVALQGFSGHPQRRLLAFLAATVVSATLNFLGMKGFVFGQRRG